MTLPTDAKARKNIPIYSGFIKYFPLAIAAVAELSRLGNDQHNPGKPLHWDRSKSGDELDAQCRHILDIASLGEGAIDTDNVLHATKNAWRAMANLQKLLERAATKTEEQDYPSRWVMCNNELSCEWETAGKYTYFDVRRAFPGDAPLRRLHNGEEHLDCSTVYADADPCDYGSKT